MQKNENIFVLSIILFVITALVALMLSVVNLLTKDTIASINATKAEAARKAVLPDAVSFQEMAYEKSGEEDIVSEIYAGKDGEKTVGYCVLVSPAGYGGEIQMMVGVNEDKTVSKVQIITMSETAGLGSKVQEPEFIGQYDGKDGSLPISVIKNGNPDDHEVVAVAGATKSSKAVTTGVNAAVSAVGGMADGGVK